jgi:hypothetical protein
MSKIKISGNQTAISEYLYILDDSYISPFACKCGGDGDAHKLNCEYQDKKYEEDHGCNFYICEFDHNGENILSTSIIYKGYTNGNLLDGCVK